MDLYSYFYNLVMQIPRGMVSTYGALAKALGDIRASRACGVMLAQNPDPPRIPCHRVVMSDGSLGGFTHPDGIKKKIELLRQEGVVVSGYKVMNFHKILFEDFKTDYPLKRLRDEQEMMKEKIVLHDDFSAKFVGGVDVSYSGRWAYGTLVIMKDVNTVLRIIKIKMHVDFPYIPTYLAYREEPVIRELLSKVDDILLLVDGNGILHPRKMGLATYVGIKNNVPTIGVAKKLLLGEIKGDEVTHKGETIGYMLKSRGKPIYVSPGHRVSQKTSLSVVERFLKYRVPEPIRLAHIYANEMRRKDAR